MDALLAGLNAAQRSAVTSPASVLQVLAPPGSGKTKTLTARVAYLINHDGFLPWNIIVCTFTIKAAREMKERIRGLVGDGIEAKLVLGTFHSVARRFLVRYGHLIGIEKNFGIADSKDSLAILKRIIKRQGYTVEPSVARSRISSLKARSTTAAQFAATSKKVEQHEFANIYTEYEETLRLSNQLDYDDLLLRCADLLRKHRDCVSTIQAVLIDEFQDTNHVQYELMSLFAQYMKRITIVGDPDQSIYGFRSAEIKNLERMREQYPETIVVNLENNYRSSGCILTAALAVIEQDESRPSKPLLPTHCVGERPILRKLPSAAVESKWIVTEIQRSKTLTGELFNFNDFSILLRSASLSRHIETSLGKAGIPYRMVGGHRFFDRVEVKIILDYLRVINQPDQNDALARIINVPPRTIGEVTVKSMLEEAELKKITLWELVRKAVRGEKRPETKLSKQAEKGLETFFNLIHTSRNKLLNADGQGCSLIDLIAYVLKKLSFEEYLRKSHPDDFENRWANVEELVAQATDMAVAAEDGINSDEDALPVVKGIEQREDSSEDLLSKFLANVALSTEVEKAEGEQIEQVTISTIHAAKGLEWPVVFIPAIYEGSIPHSRAEDTDEERRLLYVGMTRAQSLLYLSCPTKNSQRENTTLSQFIAPRNVTRVVDTKGPSFGFGVTQDLARILRRPCPPESVIQGARGLIERAEDDLWPLDGEELDPENNYWEPSNINSDTLPTSLPSKRRRVEAMTAVTTFAASVTTQNPSGYTVSSTTIKSGFVSAATHMQTIREIEASRKDLCHQGSTNTKAHQNESKKFGASLSTTKTTKKRPAGQGSITSFFASSTPTATQATGKPHQPSTTLKIYPPLPALPTLTRQDSLHDISHVHTVQTEQNLPYAAPSLPTHKLRNAPLHRRPRKAAHEEEVEATRYVLLSSSPVKSEDGERNAAGNEVVNKDSSSPIKPPISTSHSNISFSNGFRPASTLRTTSMAQLRNQPAPQRRTLGTRRSLQGWSVKTHQPPRPR
ncbi:UvrD-helicase-domain-containing protein [Lepidopterella palustris CBS 459.81]|uniref:DNA 3'-5' helicase n=1 Tax=Lepidopterella palustris CBS 459.81 TaxID=1314670 RepID=A0A8E2JH68_9PEZI|nr:UvrD-helicase-domain-containing protein [Lepidopterella palustris CBS 459.81]